jgi:NAD(P)-dependent dehydrogenase (short-subunit alcohol dehydrogenase family)
MKLKDRVAVVTGAGRNIGETVAQLFAAEGAKIAVVDLDRPRAERTAAAVESAGGTAAAFVTDVSKASEAASTSWSTTWRSPTTNRSWRSPRRNGTGS